MGNYLSIDIGSTSTKAALYRPEGTLAASRSVNYTIQYPHPGWAEQDPKVWWDATRQCCHHVLEDFSGEEIEVVSVSGQAPGCVAIDRQGKALRPAILWMDRRAIPQVEKLHIQLGANRAETIGGNTLDSYFGGLKWAWFQQNEPRLYNKTWKFLQANNYVSFRLTGEISTDPSQAGLCSPCFNLQDRRWDPSICDLMGLDFDKLPPIFPSNMIIGQVTKAASIELGIPVGIPVICGGGDFACACLGAGVVQPGSAAMMLGTSGNLLIPASLKTDPRLLNTIHVTGQNLSLGAVMAGGAVNWFKTMLSIDKPDIFELLDAEASQTPPGAEGLVFLPYLMGERTPIWDPYARGVFIGLSTSHTRGHLYRAVLEGVAYAFRQMMEIISNINTPITEIIAINGGARSPLWRQIFADVLEVPIRWRPTSGGTSLGAAFLAAQSSTKYLSIADLSAWLEPTQDTFPNLNSVYSYHSLYEVFCSVHDRLKDLFPKLNETSFKK
jgi:xylulokinase